MNKRPFLPSGPNNTMFITYIENFFSKGWVPYLIRSLHKYINYE